MGLFDFWRRREAKHPKLEVSTTSEPGSTSPRRDFIESRESIVETLKPSSQNRRESTGVEEISKSIEVEQTPLRLRQREQFALGVGYGAFHSTLNEIRDRVAEIQKVLDQDVAKERSIEEVSKKLETLSRVYDEHKNAVPCELAAETRRRIEEARLSTKLMEVYAAVQSSRMITPAELATKMNLRPNTCSQYLNELAARGLIQKIGYGQFGVSADTSATSQNASDQAKEGV
jgi:ribosomal protein S25